MKMNWYIKHVYTWPPRVPWIINEDGMFMAIPEDLVKMQQETPIFSWAMKRHNLQRYDELGGL